MKDIGQPSPKEGSFSSMRWVYRRQIPSWNLYPRLDDFRRVYSPRQIAFTTAKEPCLPPNVYPLDESAKVTLFADDTSLFFSHKSPSFFTYYINLNLDQISKWLVANKLTLNVSKSNLVVFKKKVNLIININGEQISQKNFAKYLGFLIDRNLSWSVHILYIAKKVSIGIGVIFKTRCLGCAIFHAFINSHLNYGIELWRSANKLDLKRLEILHKKAIRILNF